MAVNKLQIILILINLIQGFTIAPPFGDQENILKGCILLGHSVSEKKMEKHLICTTPERKTLLVYEYNPNNGRTTTVLKHKFQHKISNVIPMDYDSSGNISYLVSFIDGAIYKNIILFTHLENEEQLSDTTSIPFVFCHMDSFPAVLIQPKGEHSYILKFYTKNGLRKNKIDISLPILHKNHTSGFIDVTGDLIANLVLETIDKGIRKIEIFKSINSNYSRLQSIELPNIIGPMVFFTRRNKADIAYVSKEKNEYFLNILKNTGDSEEIFNLDIENKKNITNTVKGYVPMLVNEYSGMAAGLTAVDLRCNSTYNLVVTFCKVGSNKTAHILFENDKKGGFKVGSSLFNDINDLIGISGSFSDIKNNGKQNLLLNHIENGSYKLDYYDNTSLSSDTYFLSALSLNTFSAFSSVIPGVSYVYHFVESSTELRAFQQPQTSYSHLSEQHANVDLGNSAQLVDIKEVGIPGTGKVFKLMQKLVPNSRILLRHANGKVKILLNLNLRAGIWKILVVYFIFGVVNASVCIWLFLADQNRTKGSELENGQFVFNFGSL